jgi:tetratricopeptide (TPR) repeat protein
MAFAFTGQCPSVDSIAELLRSQASTLPPIERGTLDWAVASCGTDEQGKVDAGLTVLSAAPRSVTFSILTNISLQAMGRHKQALAVLQDLDPATLSGGPLHFYWTFLSLNYHALGDFRHELEAANQGLTSKPPDSSFMDRKIGALAGLGRMEEIRGLMRDWFPEGHQASDGPPTFLATCAALEAGAHGDPALRRELLERVVEWFETHPSVDPLEDVSFPCLWNQLGAVYEAGHLDQARTAFERRARADPESQLAHAGLGAVAARRGDRVEAERMEAWLSTQSIPDASLGRARIALLLGDKNRAVELLKLARSRGVDVTYRVHLDPDLQSLRADSTYKAFLRSSE